MYFEHGGRLVARPGKPDVHEAEEYVRGLYEFVYRAYDLGPNKGERFQQFVQAAIGPTGLYGVPSEDRDVRKLVYRALKGYGRKTMPQTPPL
jgi:hypothetical protein